MSGSSRSRKLNPLVDQPLEIPNDLPVPSTSRPLQPRSRATSLARSEAARSASGSRPASRGSSQSISPSLADDRTHEQQEIGGASSQENTGWQNHAQHLQSIPGPSTLYSLPQDYDSPSQGFQGPSQMEYSDYYQDSNSNPMLWREGDHNSNSYQESLPGDISRPSRGKRKRDDAVDSDLLGDMRDRDFSHPLRLGFEQGESFSSASGGTGSQRRQSGLNFPSDQFTQQPSHIDSDHDEASVQRFLTRDEINQNSGKGSSPISSQKHGNAKRKGKGKARAKTPDPDSVIDISDSPPAKYTQVKAQPKKMPVNDPLSSYTCPICFSPPTNATLTPCGHICCGACLFAALKATMQRAAMPGPGGLVEARCPVCRADIPGWDGKGGGVIGLKARAIFRL